MSQVARISFEIDRMKTNLSADLNIFVRQFGNWEKISGSKFIFISRTLFTFAQF